MSVQVHMRHIRAAKMCSSGTRAFFKRHEMDWQLFLSEGLPEEEFLRTGDAMAAHVVEVARVESQGTDGELFVYIEHMRAAGLCSNEARAFALKHGLDWNKFLSTGLPASVLEATGDPQALAAIEEARRG